MTNKRIFTLIKFQNKNTQMVILVSNKNIHANVDVIINNITYKRMFTLIKFQNKKYNGHMDHFGSI